MPRISKLLRSSSSFSSICILYLFNKQQLALTKLVVMLAAVAALFCSFTATGITAQVSDVTDARDYIIEQHEVDLFINSYVQDPKIPTYTFPDVRWTPEESCSVHVVEKISVEFFGNISAIFYDDWSNEPAGHARRRLSRYMPHSLSYLRPPYPQDDKNVTVTVLHKPYLYGDIEFSRMYLHSAERFDTTWMTWIVREVKHDEVSNTTVETTKPLVGFFIFYIEYDVQGFLSSAVTADAQTNTLKWPVLWDLKVVPEKVLINAHVPFPLEEKTIIYNFPRNATLMREYDFMDGFVVGFEFSFDPLTYVANRATPLSIVVYYPRYATRCYFNDLNNDPSRFWFAVTLVLVLVISALVISSSSLVVMAKRMESMLGLTPPLLNESNRVGGQRRKSTTR